MVVCWIKFRQSPPTIEIELKKQGTKGMGSYSHLRWDLNLSPKSIITSKDGVIHLTWIWSPSAHWLRGRTKPSNWNLKSKCETAVTKVCLVQYNMPAILWHKMDITDERRISHNCYIGSQCNICSCFKTFDTAATEYTCVSKFCFSYNMIRNSSSTTGERYVEVKHDNAHK